jgi:hypothetical protein
MKRWLLLVPFLVLGAAPRAPFRLEALLPENALFFAEIPSAAEFRQSFQKTPLFRLFEDEEVRQFMDAAREAFLRDFKAFAAEFEKETGVPWDQAWELPSGQVAFAAPTLIQEGQPDLVMTFDAAGRRDALVKGLAFLRRSCEKRKIRTETWKAGENEVLSGVIDGDVRWHAAVLGDALVAATWKGRVEQLAAALREPPAAPLGKSAAFARAREKSGAREAFFYADLAGFVKSAGEQLGEDEKKAVAALGLGGFSFAAGGLTFGEAHATERIFLGTTGKPRGLARFLSIKGAAPGFDVPPADALQYLSFSIDTSELFDTFLEVAKAADEAGHEQILEQIADFEKKAGFSIKDDLFAAFGPRVWAYSALPREGVVPDSVTGFEVRDAAKFDKCLRAALKNLSAELGTIEFEGRKIHYLKFDQPGEEEIRIPLSSIYFMREGDRLLTTGLASFGAGYGAANALKRHVLRQAKPRLAEAPAVRRWLDGKTGDASLVLYLDLERAFNLAYNTAAPVLTMFRDALRGEGLGTDLMRLPLGETLGRHLGQSIHLVRVEADGLRAEGLSPCGLTVTTAAYLAAAAVVVTPAVRKSLVQAKTSRCMSNCYSVSFAVTQHQTDKAKYPSKTGDAFLKELAGLQYLQGELACPHAGKPAYRGPVRDINQMQDEDVIFCDEPGNHPDGSINVVRRNGQVETLGRDHPDYRKALDTTKGLE